MLLPRLDVDLELNAGDTGPGEWWRGEGGEEAVGGAQPPNNV